ncbi:WD40 repeat domain-containing protein [Actinoplanes sp. NPDC023714]|uniref:WD40 repeat domain-containing protein n=1 Tax=Actinoplanes sp. NPDC023714 TaxID=3154322 RepID=UPI003404F47B
MRKQILLVASTTAVVAIAALGVTQPWRGAPGDTIPGGLELPWMWQATVAMDAPGRAAVLVGGDTLGFNGSDIYDAEGKLAVVGRNGEYRTLLYGGVDSIAAGEDVLLSPDGRRVAGPSDDDSSLVVTDLDTGAEKHYDPEGNWSGAVAWAPDGRSVLASRYDDTLALLDLESGKAQTIGDRVFSSPVRTASRAAFAPDGRHLAVTSGESLQLVDRTGKTVWTSPLGDRTYLAGTGAFSPDGRLIALANLSGCLDDCDEQDLAARTWTVTYLNATTGKPAEGPALSAVTGSAIRALGWSQGRDLVILRYEPEKGAHRDAKGDASFQAWNDTGWYETGHITLQALTPDGQTRTLLDPPDGVLTMDVSADLLQQGAFGGPTPYAAPFPARSIIGWALSPLICIIPVLLGLYFTFRPRRRPRVPNPEPQPLSASEP